MNPFDPDPDTPDRVSPDHDSFLNGSIQSVVRLPTNRVMPQILVRGTAVLAAMMTIQQPCQGRLEFFVGVVGPRFNFATDASHQIVTNRRVTGSHHRCSG